MPHVPDPAPRHPLPEQEPIPTTPDYWDLLAGDLGTGHVVQLNSRDARKRKKKIPFGFRKTAP